MVQLAAKSRFYLESVHKANMFVIPAIPKAFGRSGILLTIKKDSGQAGMTDKEQMTKFINRRYLVMSTTMPSLFFIASLILFQSTLSEALSSVSFF